MRKFWLALSILVYPSLVALFSSPALAQDKKWELEGYAGLSFTADTRSGMTAMPPAGEPFTTVDGFPSRRVSSWTFGDGVSLLNQVLNHYVLTVPPRPRPEGRSLNPILQRPLIEPRDGGVFGVRLGRRLSSRLIVELAIDRLPSVQARKSARDEFAAAAYSFEIQWIDLLGSNGFPLLAGTQPSVIGGPTTAKQTRLLLTGAANLEFATSERLRPYVAGGAGVVRRAGSSPTASFSGSVAYDNDNDAFPGVRDRDLVKITGTTKEIKPVGVAGGGVRMPFSERIGLRADARVYLSGNRDETFVSATPPTRRAGAMSGYFNTLTSPSIQFQTNSQLPDSESSLSGPPISSFRTFQGTGIETNVSVTIGFYWRF